MRVLVTGSTGFVGRTLLRTLPTGSVRCALRSDGRRDASARDAVVVGAINADTRWQQALDDIQCVVHLAARVHVMNPTAADEQRFYETNVLGTQQLAAAAAERGVRRFIFLSSIKVNGEATGDTPFTAADIPRPLDQYGISKQQAEQKLFEIAGRSGMEALVVRPPLVYGEGVRANFLRLLRWVRTGVPLPLGAVRNRRSMVSVWNLCDLLATIVAAPSLPSAVLTVSDGEDLSTAELIGRLARQMARPARLLPVPVVVLRAIGALTGRRAEVARLCDSLQVDISATQSMLDWHPPLSVDEGLRRTVYWFMHEAH